MAKIEDTDRFFIGAIEASMPDHLIEEGKIRRLINGRFVEGAITNAIGFDEISYEFIPILLGRGVNKRNNTYPYTSPISHEELIQRGDMQLFAPLSNILGNFLVFCISGSLYRLDLDTKEVVEITPLNACLPDNSNIYPLSFVDNDGGTYGVGGYLVIFNYPNKSILVNHETARLALESNYEVIPSRLGATAGSRLFTISGDNLLWASDPLGGYNSLAPLTFEETISPSGTYTGQIFTIGSSLDIEKVTAVCRLPRYSAPFQDFAAQQLVVSTRNKKYLIAAALPRESWESSQFISYLGSADGIAGANACTLIGERIVYISTRGRIKTLGQDEQLETSLSETFLDDPLGQYLNYNETELYYRDWYKDLDHSRSILKFSKNRLYATVYPYKTPALGRLGEKSYSYSHRALAVGSLDSTTQLGSQANISWEGFYDWLNPIGLTTIADEVYVASKDSYGRIKFYKENLNKIDNHNTVIYTRGYLAKFDGRSKSILEGYLYFRKINGNLHIKISYNVDGKWVLGNECETSSKLYRFSFRANKCISNFYSVPLKIEIVHNGCRFELAGINISGETHKLERL